MTRKTGCSTWAITNSRPWRKTGSPVLTGADITNTMQGALESSNVEISVEFSQLIEAQRAYQFSLRMVTTSDEVEGIINTLR